MRKRKQKEILMMYLAALVTVILLLQICLLVICNNYDIANDEQTKEISVQSIEKGNNHNEISANNVDEDSKELNIPINDKKEITKNTYMLTAYCSCKKCCGKSDGITSTGTKATAGRTIAVDPQNIPYGTKVIINGNTYIAEDCGGAIKGNRIDIYFDTHQEALNFGVQYADVYIGA